MHRTCLSVFVCACISLCVCVWVRDFVSSEIVFTVTDREMLASQPVPIKTLRLWLMAPFNCGFAQMGLHLSQDPCCLHSDPQRRVIHQLSFVNVTFFFLFFTPPSLAVCFPSSYSALLFWKNPFQYLFYFFFFLRFWLIGVLSFTGSYPYLHFQLWSNAFAFRSFSIKH